ncbi:MAG: GTP-binding protein [Candidatus Thorarchaeota archaeon]|jgi:small GTP-binding protein|nr:GTP-binding protein [Candidatus Thorarchaeota archaeon]
MDDRSFTRIYKIVVVGSGAVGKTSLILRFTTGAFRESYIRTLGAGFAFKNLDVDNRLIKLQIWDLAGQPQMKKVRSNFYTGASGVIFIYDVTRHKTFDEILGWKTEADTHAQGSVSLLVANKTDMVQDRAVTEAEGREMAGEFGWNYVETSVKLNENVVDVFKIITREIMRAID